MGQRLNDEGTGDVCMRNRLLWIEIRGSMGEKFKGGSVTHLKKSFGEGDFLMVPCWFMLSDTSSRMLEGVFCKTQL